jgi:FAD binding domain-containing protein/berberine-like enzyme
MAYAPSIIGEGEIERLASVVRGPVLTADHPEFEAEVAPFNVAARHTPHVAVGALDASDVVEAVRWATRNNLPISVQATGHGAVVSFDRGLLISTKRMQDLSIDPETRIARIGAGVKWRSVIEAAAPHSLVPMNGSSSDVGAVGYTLGGGLPVLGRTFGFASDYVRAFDVVTADGCLHIVTEHEEPDLFWALRGGKTNVGIVTSMTVELIPLSTLYGGCIFFDGAHAQRLFTAYRTWTASLPESMTTAIKLLRLPPMPEIPEPLRGRLTVQLVAAHVGDPAEGARLLQPMRECAPVIFDDIREMPYSAVDALHRDPEHPVPFKEAGALLSDLTSEAIEDILSVAGPQANCPLLLVELRHMGGALSRTSPVPDAVGARDAAYSLFMLGVLMPPIADMVPTALATALTTLSPHTTGRTFVNFHGTPSTVENRSRPWSTDVYERLVDIKRQYDPQDTFRFGHSLSEPISMS